MESTKQSVQFTTQDRQWDARFNVQQDEDIERLLQGIRADYERGKFRYILVGGPEIGTRPYQDDYQIRHVHVAAIFNNRVSKSAILKNWNVKQGNGYYLVPRKRDLPYSGWRDHHIKVFSKVDPSRLILFEMGELPKEDTKLVKASEEEKKHKIDEILINIRQMIENNQEKEAFEKYPRNYLIYGERLKAMVSQKRDFFKTNGNPHIWLYGTPGSGKTAILSYIYPNYYKKNLYNKFFDLFDPEKHTHVMLEDLDHEAVERLSINFIKTLCDEAGFPIDQKYKTPQLIKTNVLITSNFSISDIMQDGPGLEQNKAAIYRRFWHVNTYNFLRILGLKLIPKFDQLRLKKEGNTDPSKLFLTWDYATDIPTGESIQSPEYYQQLIKDTFYR